MKAKLLLVLALLLLPVLALADIQTVENEQLILSLDTQTLAITLTDKATGRSLQSGVDAEGTSVNDSWKSFLASSLAIEITKGTAVTTERIGVAAANTDITVRQVPGGMDAQVDFVDLGQKISLRLRLEEDSLSVTVPKDGILEYGTETHLCGLYLLPCMGATHLDEKAGYMFVPEAGGAIINFSDGNGMGNTPFSKRVYGTNIGVDKIVMAELNRPAEKISLPVYGLAYTTDGFGYLAVIENGDEAAEIMAYPAGVITEFNWAAARFTLREEYTMQTTRTKGLRSRETNAYLRDMTMRFYVLRGDEATYSGMAGRYRRALEEDGRLLTTDTVYRPRIDFLGAESEKFLLWNTLVPMTTIQQASDIVTEYSKAGLTAPLVVYRGFLSGGLSLAYGSGNVSLESALGGMNDLTALKNQLEESGGRLYLEIDPVSANQDRMYNMRLDVVRNIGQTVAEVSTGMDLYPAFYYQTPGRTSQVLADFAKKYGEKFQNAALVTMPNTLYSYYSAGRNHSRGETAADYLATMQNMEMRLALAEPFARYYDAMSIYLDMPLGATNYSYLSAEVPFLPMVLSCHVPYYTRWVNFDSNQRRQFLKMVEYGAYPSYLITGEEVQKLINTNSCDVFCAKWNVMMPRILTEDQELAELYAQLGGRQMLSHQVVSEQVSKVVYQDGYSLWVNYGSQDYINGSAAVPAMGYLLEKGVTEP